MKKLSTWFAMASLLFVVLALGTYTIGFWLVGKDIPPNFVDIAGLLFAMLFVVTNILLAVAAGALVLAGLLWIVGETLLHRERSRHRKLRIRYPDGDRVRQLLLSKKEQSVPQADVQLLVTILDAVYPRPRKPSVLWPIAIGRGRYPDADRVRQLLLSKEEQIVRPADVQLLVTILDAVYPLPRKPSVLWPIAIGVSLAILIVVLYGGLLVWLTR